MNKRLIASLAVAVSLAILTGCGSHDDPAPGGTLAGPQSVVPAPPTPSVEAPVIVDGVKPASVSIPSIKASSSLIPVGLTASGEMDVPSVSNPKQAAWFQPGPEPGQPGPAVIVGHIDGNHIPGVFYDLKKVHEGDEIDVSLQDGQKRVFTVYKTELAAKAAFPADRVFGKTDAPELRVITCGGDFDATAHSYKGNTILYAKLKV